MSSKLTMTRTGGKGDYNCSVPGRTNRMQHRDVTCRECWDQVPEHFKATVKKLRGLGVRYGSPEWKEFRKMCGEAVLNRESSDEIKDVLADLKAGKTEQVSAPAAALGGIPMNANGFGGGASND